MKRHNGDAVAAGSCSISVEMDDQETDALAVLRDRQEVRRLMAMQLEFFLTDVLSSPVPRAEEREQKNG